MTAQSRRVVGIDLGTTNSAIASALADRERPPIEVHGVSQLVELGEAADRPLLPSFLYVAGDGEFPAGSLDLPWAKGCPDAVGHLARSLGEKVPRRLVASAKSWLCHPRVDRTSPILPWGAEGDVRKVSPLAASTRYLRHLRDAWNHSVAGPAKEDRLEHQEVYLTVPASFDAVARNLTARAAEEAGLGQVTLLEEPQAAFYAWLDRMGDAWRKRVKVGDVVLVVDIGGGTTDFTLIAVTEEKGALVLDRIAVGEHILLGGDNMDLALAHHAAAKLREKGHRLDTKQTASLWHACRVAKETLLSAGAPPEVPIALVGSGSRLIGGTIQTTLSTKEVSKILLEGFFAPARVDERPETQRRTGLQEIGLEYAADALVARHLAGFLADHVDALGGRAAGKFLHPTAVLFNGGVTKAAGVQERLIEILDGWLAGDGAPPVRVLEGSDPDLAVARGAAYYGLVRRGRGVRIRGGLARTYYVGIETAMPAVPGRKPPIKALCVAPFGMEEGTDAELGAREFGLVVGEPVEFRFLSSTTRRHDAVGTIVEDWDLEGIEELAPLEHEVEAAGREGQRIPVRLRSRVTEVGTLEVWCVATEGDGEWKLEFNVRESD